ncbi:hypothetical protein [uncultured Desulfuromonas sp.]|uniref:hypothetical protein n=1 Tax=uncultured Desulfuromonas sp. TaxID=181013 RepID=UPI002AABD8F8|nr:hypothetical protein [uncultured Desulfuromonas sp.]
MLSIVSSLLTIKPKIKIDGSKLIAKTSPMILALSLYFRNKVVTIDRRKKLVKIDSTWFWVFKNSTIIPFQQIEGITYKYDNFWFDFSLNLGTKDQVEEFTVSLKLTGSDQTIKLFSFVGEGIVNAPINDYEEFDLSGNQESSSKNYVELVMKFTEKKLI